MRRTWPIIKSNSRICETDKGYNGECLYDNDRGGTPFPIPIGRYDICPQAIPATGGVQGKGLGQKHYSGSRFAIQPAIDFAIDLIHLTMKLFIVLYFLCLAIAMAMMFYDRWDRAACAFLLAIIFDRWADRVEEGRP